MSKCSNHSGTGMFWFFGWLFTIGLAKLAGWKILWALFIWPYYIGKLISQLPAFIK